MKLKKFWKRFWTLNRHHEDGFTLVELIVVIAIMGILAGVGTVAYSGYITNANKNADKVLVGNIIRAIETGTNSYAFVGDDSFKIGKLSYPVGIVVLSKDNGTQVWSSNAKPNFADEECVFEEKTFYYPADLTTQKCSQCNKYSPNPKQEMREITLKYCVTHSSGIPTQQTLNYAQSYTDGHSQGCPGTTHTWNANNGSYTGLCTSSIARLFKPADNRRCEYAANPGMTNGMVDQHPSSPLYKAITAAFGDNLESITLSYGDWKTDEGINYSTFYSTAPSMMETLETLANQLAPLSGMDAIGTTKPYADGGEVLSGVAENIVTRLTEEQWMNAWNGAATATWDSYGFNLSGRENYSAARMAYNNAFASYLEATDSRFAVGGEYNSYISQIKGFYSREMMGIGLPGLVTTDTFTDSESPLKAKINNDEVFNLMAEKYEAYKVSDVCKENGRTVYDVLFTVNETSSVANAYVEANGSSDYDIYDYYNNYVNEMAALYNKAQSEAGNGIVIIVSVEDGVVTCNVSPAAANPRKD